MGGALCHQGFFLKPILKEYLGKDQKALEDLKLIIKWVLFACGGILSS